MSRIRMLLAVLLAAALMVGIGVLIAFLTGDDGSSGSLAAATSAPRRTAAPSAPQQAPSAERAPFVLNLSTVELGTTEYISFEVYFNGGDGQELYYQCGRKYIADEVNTIRWQGNEGYNILVSFKNGKSEVYRFDGGSGWSL